MHDDRIYLLVVREVCAAHTLLQPRTARNFLPLTATTAPPRSLNMIHTQPGGSAAPVNPPSHLDSEKPFFSRINDDGMLPLVEIPEEVVQAVLLDGVPPLGEFKGSEINVYLHILDCYLYVAL